MSHPTCYYVDVHSWLSYIEKHNNVGMTGIFRVVMNLLKGNSLSTPVMPAVCTLPDERIFPEEVTRKLEVFLRQPIHFFNPNSTWLREAVWILPAIDHNGEAYVQMECLLKVAFVHDAVRFQQIDVKSRMAQAFKVTDFFPIVSKTTANWFETLVRDSTQFLFKPEVVRWVDWETCQIDTGEDVQLGRVHCLPNAHRYPVFDELAFEPDRGSLNIGVSISAVAPNKNLPQACRIAAIRRYQEEITCHYHVGVALEGNDNGDGSYTRDAYVASTPTEELHVDNNRAGRVDLVKVPPPNFLGNKTDQEVDDLLNSSKDFYCTSTDEGFSMTPMEAIIRGVPHVFLSDIPVHREIYGLSGKNQAVTFVPRYATSLGKPVFNKAWYAKALFQKYSWSNTYAPWFRDLAQQVQFALRKKFKP